MIHIEAKKDCCGCEACKSACPLECITMIGDEQGFLYPKVDFNRCVSCNKCEMACPILNKKESELCSNIKGYAAINNDTESRIRSSSGGIFHVLASNILDRGGVVYGAAYDSDFCAHHIKVSDASNLELLQGSKYIQSRIDGISSDVKNELETGKTVLFSGTACQIEGLYRFLQKEYNNLYLVDVLCHGVPSVNIWKKYLCELKRTYGGNITHLSTRNKVSGWKNYSVYAKFDNGQEYKKRFYEDVFMKLFLSNVCLRDSCYDCKFKEIARTSDITIGDAWGIGNYLPEMDDDNGTSVVFLRTYKGSRLLSEVSDKLTMVRQGIDILVPPNNDARVSVKQHRNRKKFWQEYAKGANMQKLLKLSKEQFSRRIYNKIRYIIIPQKRK